MTPYDNRCEDCGSFLPADGGPCKTCPREAAYREDKLQPCARAGCDERHDNAKYCSKRCMWDAGKKREDERECEGCGDTFAVAPRNPEQKYCTRACYHEHQGAGVEVSRSRENYFIADGQVVFSVDNKLLRIPVNRWDSICADYSSYGGDLTRAEVARKHGIPIPLMKRVLTAYEQYKASPPMMRERVAEAEDLQPLVQEAVEHVEHELLNRIERQRLSKIEREWRELRTRLRDEQRFEEAGRRVASELTLPDLPEAPDTRRDWEHVIAITTDEQLGRPTWGEGVWGEDYDSKIGGRRLIGEGVLGSAWVEAQGGAGTVYRAYNGDFFEGLTGKTAHDTPMDLDTRFERTWDIALRAVITNARAWKRACDRLVLIFVAGNHDRFDTHKFASAIRYAIEGESVEVRATPKMYDAIRVGDALHVFDHGYRLSKLSGYKAKVDAETVARKAGGEKYHGAEHIYYHVGHKHERAVVQVGDHMEIIRHPALCEASEWEHEGRWVAQPGADVILLDDRGRIDTPKRLYREALDRAGADAA